MIPVVLMDAGPLVAIINENDYFNDWARRQSRNLKPPFITCESVISEACFLLGSRRKLVMDLLDTQFLQIGFSLKQEVEATLKLMNKYADVPMSLADACLVRMSEIHDGSKVFTLDSNFKIYRRSGRKTIPLIYPERK